MAPLMNSRLVARPVLATAILAVAYDFIFSAVTEPCRLSTLFRIVAVMDITGHALR
jgi:hypothetical protein